jgi:hypothetical protein
VTDGAVACGGAGSGGAAAYGSAEGGSNGPDAAYGGTNKGQEAAGGKCAACGDRRAARSAKGGTGSAQTTLRQIASREPHSEGSSLSLGTCIPHCGTECFNIISE